MHEPLFSRLAQLACAGLTALLLSGCPPLPQQAVIEDHGPDTYVATETKLYDRHAEFDIRWRIVHPQIEGFNPTLAVTNRELTIERCTKCHDCGFARAFDLENYQTLEWNPQIRGEDWGMPIRRMIPKELSLLNEVIAERIYTFLRDETLGQYDEAADPAGAIVVEVDETAPAAGQSAPAATEEAPQPPAEPDAASEAEPEAESPEADGDTEAGRLG